VSHAHATAPRARLFFLRSRRYWGGVDVTSAWTCPGSPCRTKRGPFEVTVVHADQALAQVRAQGPLDPSTVDMLTAVLEFERFVGRDLVAMWRWLSTSEVDADPADTRRILPTAHTVDQWLSAQSKRA
jgi:hypothetical protein